MEKVAFLVLIFQRRSFPCAASRARVLEAGYLLARVPSQQLVHAANWSVMSVGHANSLGNPYAPSPRIFVYINRYTVIWLF